VQAIGNLSSRATTRPVAVVGRLVVENSEHLHGVSSAGFVGLASPGMAAAPLRLEPRGPHPRLDLIIRPHTGNAAQGLYTEGRDRIGERACFG
jgi:hypothetical protein